MSYAYITVIVPVYNVKDYLERCVESICGQTYPNLEILLVDDGSTDGSGKICDELAKKDTRIKVIHKPNGGLSDARNAGLDVATGDYIGYVDSDDYIEPDMFEILLTNIEEHQADISCCRYARVYYDGRREPVGEDHAVHVYEGLDGLKEYLYGKTVDPFVCNKLFRACYTRPCRTNGVSMRFIRGIVGEDNPFNTAILKHVQRIVVAGESKYNYLQARPGAITNVNVSQKKIDSIFWWDAMRRECHENYPQLEPYALRRQVLFYVGLYNTLSAVDGYKEVKDSILAFINEHKSEILHSELNERIIKVSCALLTMSPALYRIAMRTYKRLFGSAAGIND